MNRTNESNRSKTFQGVMSALATNFLLDILIINLVILIIIIKILNYYVIMVHVDDRPYVSQ